MKSYYTKHLSYVVAQPKIREDILASLLCKNGNEVAAQQEWEAEWNQAGLASRLSEKVLVVARRELEQLLLLTCLHTNSLCAPETVVVVVVCCLKTFLLFYFRNIELENGKSCRKSYQSNSGPITKALERVQGVLD